MGRKPIRPHRSLRLALLQVALLLPGCAETHRERIEYPSGQVRSIANLRRVEGQWVPHGAYVEYYADGTKAASGSLAYGEKHGTWKTWYEDGTPESETTYRHGRRHGQATQWHPNGRRQWTCRYHDGHRHGREMRWMSSGDLEWEAEYEKDAVLSYTRYAAGGRKLESLTPDRGVEHE